MAGTVTTLAAVARAIDPYDSARVHGLRISAAEISATGRRLAAQSLAERQTIAGLQPKRADVIPIGAVIVEAVLQWAQADELIVSDRGVRWGLAMALASSTVARQSNSRDRVPVAFDSKLAAPSALVTMTNETSETRGDQRNGRNGETP